MTAVTPSIGHGAFGNVGAEDDFALRRGRDGAVLLFGREVAVELHYQEVGALQGSGGSADFGGSGEEDEDVSVEWQEAVDGGGDLILEKRGGVGRVVDLQREELAFGAEDGAVVEVSRDGCGIERGGHDDEPDAGALEKGEGEVGIEVALMKFVEDDDVDAAQVRVGHEAAGEDAFGEEAEAGAGSGDVFEADLIADGFAEALAQFGGDASGSHAGGESAGFEDEDFASGDGQEGGRDARGLSCSGRGFDDEVLLFSNGREDLREERVNWKLHLDR
jgi:hypothetical protein